MKFLKTYEGWLRDLFKDGQDNMWDNYLSAEMDSRGYNRIMSAAYSGNFKKFKYYFSKYVDNVNDVNDDMTALLYVAQGRGILSDKKKMIEMLVDEGADMFFESEGKTFYDLIKKPKLKQWVEDTYPNFLNELELKRSANKYNI